MEKVYLNLLIQKIGNAANIKWLKNVFVKKREMEIILSMIYNEKLESIKFKDS